MSLKKITIIGLGLIGGSMGLALKKRLPHLEICGVDRDGEALEEALRRGAIDQACRDIGEGVREADLVFLAAPMAAMQRITWEMVPSLKQGAIVTDVGSTKANIVAMMEELLPPGVLFLGGHPMAGSEKWGIKGSNELLFENAAYILTPTPRTSIETMDTIRGLVETIGARVIILSPEDHDCKVAAVSHLPHLAASALVNTVGVLEDSDGGYFALAAGGFRDTTRIAASNSEMWCDIMLRNKEALLPLVRNFRFVLREFEEVLEDDDSSGLLNLLIGARQWREQVPTGMKGILPQIYNLTVTAPDRPGVIGELSHLLGLKRVNIIDIEIQRVREEDGGTIRLGFSTEQGRDQALEVLEENGFNVQKSGV